MFIKGIKCVDFFITATGEGVVNHNGAFPVYNPSAEQTVSNHMFPKLRGLDPMQRIAKNGQTGMSLSLTDADIAKAALIVSAECLRSAIFRDASFGLYKVTVDNVEDVLSSIIGIVRGYLITEGGRNFARKSPLYMTDFHCASPGLVFNQGTNSRARGTVDEKQSLYSYFKTDKDLHYVGKASLSIEDLQFIPLENSLGRSAYDHQVSTGAGQALAERVTQFLNDLASSQPDQGKNSLKPEATFVKKVTRRFAVYKGGDAGLLLNNDALKLLCDEVAQMIKSIYIRQGKGYLAVKDVVVDYNDSSQVFRAEDNPAIACSLPQTDFACYYDVHDLTDVEYKRAQAEHQSALKEIDEQRQIKKQVKVAKKDAKQAKAAKALEDHQTGVAA